MLMSCQNKSCVLHLFQTQINFLTHTHTHTHTHISFISITVSPSFLSKAEVTVETPSSTSKQYSLLRKVGGEKIHSMSVQQLCSYKCSVAYLHTKTQNKGEKNPPPTVQKRTKAATIHPLINYQINLQLN